MALLDLQRRMTEIGRVRIGHKVRTSSGKEAPAKLDSFRITSPSRDLIDSVAELYGGQPRPWKPDPKAAQQWEITTEATALDIVLVPGQVLSQFYEQWSGGGCSRRCDGVTETVSDGPCICPLDHEERRTLAAKGGACKPTTRFSFLLRDAGVIGLVRLESHGYNTAIELSGMADLLERVTKAGSYVPAVLRLDQRTSKKNGQTFRYAVPVVEIHQTVAQVAGALGMATPPTPLALPTMRDVAALPVGTAIPSSPIVEPEKITPAPGRVEVDEDGNPKSWKPLPPVEDEPLDADVVAEQILNPTAPGAGRKPRSNAAEPIKRTGLAPRGRIIDPGQTSSTVEAPSTGPEDKSPVEAVVESEVVPGGTAPLGGDHPLVLAETQPPAEDAVSPTEALRAPLTRSQGLAKKAREAGLDDESRGDLIETLTKGRTRSSKEVTDNEAGTLHGWFHKLKSKTVSLSYDPEGKACLLPMAP